ncbi:hypothetical protein OG900_33080 [Streptomyces sp. NBC_00433]
MTTKTAWPYDADRDDPLTKLRIPVVASSHPEWNYIVAFIAVDTAPYSWGSGERPTDAEAQQLASFLGYYIDTWYGDSYKARLAERPFDVDGGANGMTFVKYGAGDWGYRRRTWTMGPLFVPQSPNFAERPIGPLTLPQLMDRIYDDGDGNDRPDWAQWKADHPDVFGGDQ